MIRANFLTASDLLELLSCVKRQHEDHGVARRANALLLLDTGMSCVQIAKVLFLDDDTVRSWHKQYLAENLDAVAYEGWKGGQSLMTTAQEGNLSVWLEERFCRSTAQIRAYMSSKFNIHYSHPGCIKLLARLGFEYRKPKALHRVVVEKQAAFIAFYNNLLKNLPADEAVYFLDAVHPEYQSKPNHGWAHKGSNLAIQTTSGRGRVNIHGVLNLETFDVPFLKPTTVNGVSSVHLFIKIEARKHDKRTIHVIWANAPYHKGPDVREFLWRKNCLVHLIQVPPCCPHLNPINRLWDVMHSHVTHNWLYRTQNHFTIAVLNFMREVLPKQWRSLRDQVTYNFCISPHFNV